MPACHQSKPVTSDNPVTAETAVFQALSPLSPVSPVEEKIQYTRDRGLDLPSVTGCSGDAVSERAPKRTSTARVRKHRALKAALRADQEAEMTIRGNPGLISEWLIEQGELDPMQAESPQAINDALSEIIRKMHSVS